MKSKLNIYKASAGSGKTFTLTIQYIYLMIRPGVDKEYCHTLAVTFTNKATSEMKDRIIGHLYGIWRGMKSSDSYVDALERKLKEEGESLTREELRSRCGRCLREILHDYNNFRVETIDSFFQSILRTLARELGQSAGMQVDLNDEEIVSLAVDNLIESLEDDPRLQRLVMDYINHQLEETGKWSVSESIKSFGRSIFSEDYMKRSEKDRQALEDEALVREFRQEMVRMETEALAEITKLAKETLERITAMGIRDSFRYPVAFTYLENVINGKQNKGSQSLTKLLEGRNEELLNAASKKAGTLDERAHAIGEEVIDFIHREEALSRIATTAMLTRKYIHPLQLLGSIDSEVRSLNEERDRINLSSTPTLLSNLIDGQDSPFVFEKIGTTLHNVMIDEFQDTSLVQWDNFRVLLFENQSMGGSDLIVGDIKQSIYRWRGGYWKLLSELKDSMRAWNPNEQTLTTNWRSDRVVIEFNNSLFPRAAEALDGIDEKTEFKLGGEKGIYNDVRQEVPERKGDKGFVRVWMKNEKDHVAMLDDMLEQIIRLRNDGLPLEQMAILVRKNRMATEIIDYFREFAPSDITISSDEAYLLGSSQLVRVIIAALRMLVTNPKQNETPARELAIMYSRLICPDAFMDAEGLTDTDRLMRTDLREMLPAELFDQRMELICMPLQELTERLYTMLHMDAIQGQEAYHFAFIDTMGMYLRDNPNDISSFLEKWDKDYCCQPIPAGRQEGIRVLSIHKSKGLEFHTLFVPFCDWDIEKENVFQKNILWCRSEDDREEFNRLGAMPIDKTTQMSRSFYSRRYDEEHLQSRVDELNALYVGFTRASHNMFIWASSGNKPLSRNSTVGDLLRVCLNPEGEFDEEGVWTQSWGSPVLEVASESASDNRMQPDYESMSIPMTTYSARLNFRQSNEAKDLLLGKNETEGQLELNTDSTRRITGTLFHRVMEDIGCCQDIEKTLHKHLSEGLITKEQTEELRTMLKQMDENEMVRSWFAPGSRVFSECEILDPGAGSKDKRHQRPDRVVMHEDGSISIVDYKFGSAHGGYQGQVRNYMRLLAGMYPGRNISGYLWYVKHKNIEEVKA